MSRKILVLGNAVADVVARTVDDVPATGSLHPETVRYFPGGCANNVAMGLARLGLSVTLAVSIGKDVFGDALMSHWQQAGINTQYVLRQPDEPTGVTIVLIDSDGERRFISAPAANRLLTLDHLPDSILDDLFAVQIAGFFTVPGLEQGALIPLLQKAQRRGVVTSLDPVGGSARERGGEYLRLLPFLDFAFLNEDEGEKITGFSDPDDIARVLRTQGASTVIIKLGRRGSRVYSAEQSFSVPSFQANNVDSTGAGDAFVATLLAALSRGERIVEAVRWASAAGAVTVETIGAVGAWDGWDELAQIILNGQTRHYKRPQSKDNSE